MVDGPIPPLTDRLEHAFASHITQLPPLTRDVLLIAAVSREEKLADIVAGTAVLSGHPVTAGVLEAAEQAGILRFDELFVRFRHPLVRAGILLAGASRPAPTGPCRHGIGAGTAAAPTFLAPSSCCRRAG